MASFVENFRKAFPNAISKEDAAKPFKLVQAVDKVMRENAQKSKENREHIVNNTFQMDKDGTNYGVGTDGKTYSYTIGFNNKMSEPKLLSAEEQKAAINKLTGGKITIEDNINNQESLTDIFRSVSRFYRDGNDFAPGKVNIAKLMKEEYGGTLPDSVHGLSYPGEKGEPDSVKIYELDNPKLRKEDEKRYEEEKWSANNPYHGEYIPTHELAHTAEFNTHNILGNWIENQKAEAEKNKGKYTFGQLFRKTFGQPDDDTRSIGDKIFDSATRQYDKWYDEFIQDVYGDDDADEGVLNTAAKNLGFKTVNDAAKTISGYAGGETTQYYENAETGEKGENKYVDPQEVFAEAYTDVLFNGNEAAPYSRELIRLYKDLNDKWLRKTGQYRSKAAKDFGSFLSALPSIGNSENLFVQSYRTAPWKYR